MIEVKNVFYKYELEEENLNDLDNVNVVNGLNFTIQKGEFLAILGHNGSGKSTFAKLLNGLLTPNKGDIIVDGMNTKSEEQIWNIRSKTGMVFQNPDNQLVATIVEDDVAFGPENLGIHPDEIRIRIDEALKAVNMLEFKESAPYLLSGGQKQRIAIAGILAMSPDYIILDEPTAMLDPSGRKEVLETIMKLNKIQKKTIILITHYMEEAALSDRIMVMEKGNVILEGTPRNVFSNVKKIKDIGLDVPQVTELAYNLQLDGYNINTRVLTVNELVKQICQ